jgi:uncharacterized membrane protein YphA (DoxX/SURF4 family)
LLLLRLTLSGMMLAQGIAYFTPNLRLLSIGPLVGIFEVLLSAALALGLFAPLTAALLGLSILLLPPEWTSPAVWNTFEAKQTIILAVAMSGVIVLLGPGAFSLDSYCFGRHEVIIPSVPKSSKR